MKFQRIFPTAVILASTPVFAVSPLITDDADTVPQGEFELVITQHHTRFSGGRSNPLLAALTYGATPQLEVAVGFGYAYEGPRGARQQGWADSELAAKWKFSDEDSPVVLNALFASVKLPTASTRSVLGTGNPDYTFGWATTWFAAETREIDFNVAYTAIDDLNFATSKDILFLGIGIREQVHERFVILGETVVETPPDRFSGSFVQARAGFQWSFGESRFIDFAFGHGLGANSDFREATLGVRIEF